MGRTLIAFLCLLALAGCGVSKSAGSAKSNAAQAEAVANVAIYPGATQVEDTTGESGRKRRYTTPDDSSKVVEFYQKTFREKGIGHEGEKFTFHIPGAKLLDLVVVNPAPNGTEILISTKS